jgi:hypothetical protein
MTPDSVRLCSLEHGLRVRFAVVAIPERMASAVAAFDVGHRGAWAAGVDPFTTCQLVGWRDMEMLRRYNIIDVKTMKRGAAKLSTYQSRS